jgi:hypothetical protein
LLDSSSVHVNDSANMLLLCLGFDFSSCWHLIVWFLFDQCLTSMSSL